MSAQLGKKKRAVRWYAVTALAEEAFPRCEGDLAMARSTDDRAAASRLTTLHPDCAEARAAFLRRYRTAAI